MAFSLESSRHVNHSVTEVVMTYSQTPISYGVKLHDEYRIINIKGVIGRRRDVIRDMTGGNEEKGCSVKSTGFAHRNLQPQESK